MQELKTLNDSRHCVVYARIKDLVAAWLIGVFCKCWIFCPFKPPFFMSLLDHVMNILSKGFLSTQRWSCMCMVGETQLSR